jgi:hypothetical protein
MTRREFFTAVAGNGTYNTKVGDNIVTVSIYDEDGNPTEDVKAFAKAQIAQLDKRNEQRKNAPSSSQAKNEPIKQAILDYTEVGNVYVASKVGVALNISTAKASALLRQLADPEREDCAFEVIDKYKPEGAKAKDAVKGYKRI